MWALAADGANAVLNVATQLYMAKKQREEEEKKRKQDLLLRGQQGLVEGAKAGAMNSQQALSQMLSGFTGALL